MPNMTRREMLFGGFGVAALLGACANTQAKPTAEKAAAPAAVEASELTLNKGGLLDRSCFIGVDDDVELADGSKTPAINFDNGATTPSLVSVLAAVQDALPMYGSIGRGKGQKSAASTERFNDARSVVLDFFGAPEDTYTCCFTGTATDGARELWHVQHRGRGGHVPQGDQDHRRLATVRPAGDGAPTSHQVERGPERGPSPPVMR